VQRRSSAWAARDSNLFEPAVRSSQHRALAHAHEYLKHGGARISWCRRGDERICCARRSTMPGTRSSGTRPTGRRSVRTSWGRSANRTVFWHGSARSRRRAGDLLAIMSAGAYGMTMSSNYNSRRVPPKVMVDGKRPTFVRDRESAGSLFLGRLFVNLKRLPTRHRGTREGAGVQVEYAPFSRS